MKRNTTYAADVAATALAPAIWGSTYFVTTTFLPAGYPLTAALLRALPAGLLLLALVRKLPHGIWWFRAFLLGALNFSFFWAMLFVSARRCRRSPPCIRRRPGGPKCDPQRLRRSTNSSACSGCRTG